MQFAGSRLQVMRMYLRGEQVIVGSHCLDGRDSVRFQFRAVVSDFGLRNGRIS
jgi:hypothetical protein